MSDEDYWPIMEVLTAYVRQHAPRGLPEEGQDSTEEAAVVKKAEDGSSEESRSTELPAPTPDIQVIMTVIRRRTRSYGHGEPEPLDLHAANLLSANLRGADLSKANLSGANLRGVFLQGAFLQGAILRGANLQGTGGVTAEIEGNGSTRIETWFGTDVQEVYTDMSKDYPDAEMITFPTQEQINQANGDGDTQLPPHLKPPRTGA